MLTKGLVFGARTYRGETTPPLTLEDESRYGNDGVFGAGAAAPTWTRLPSGLWVLSYDGGDYVSLGTTSTLNFTAGAFTILMWANVTNIDAVRTFFTRGAANVDGYHFHFDLNSRIYCFTNQAAASTRKFSDVLTLGGWHLYSASRDGVAMVLGEDGVDVTAGGDAIDDPITNSRQAIIGGISTPTGNMLGQGGHLRIYDYAMSAAQIYKIFNSERSLFGV